MRSLRRTSRCWSMTKILETKASADSCTFPDRSHLLLILLDMNLRSRLESKVGHHHFQPEPQRKRARELFEELPQPERFHHFRGEFPFAVYFSHSIQQFVNHSLQPPSIQSELRNHIGTRDGICKRFLLPSSLGNSKTADSIENLYKCKQIIWVCHEKVGPMVLKEYWGMQETSAGPFTDIMPIDPSEKVEVLCRHFDICTPALRRLLQPIWKTIQYLVLEWSLVSICISAKSLQNIVDFYSGLRLGEIVMRSENFSLVVKLHRDRIKSLWNAFIDVWYQTRPFMLTLRSFLLWNGSLLVACIFQCSHIFLRFRPELCTEGEESNTSLIKSMTFSLTVKLNRRGGPRRLPGNSRRKEVRSNLVENLLVLSLNREFRIRARLLCAVHIEDLQVVPKKLSNRYCFMALFLSTRFRDFHFQELHENWVFRSSGLLYILQVLYQLHRFRV